MSPPPIGIGKKLGPFGSSVATPGRWPPGSATYVAPPLAASLTLVNLGTKTLVDVPATSQNLAALAFSSPPNGGGNTRALAVQAAPAGPFTFTIGCYFSLCSSNNPLGGICIRDSGGKFVEFVFGWDPGLIQSEIDLSTWNSPTVNAGVYFVTGFQGGPFFDPVFMRVVYDGANLSFSFSADLEDSHFVKFLTAGALSFLADITTIGIEIDVSGNNPPLFGGTTADIALVDTVFHWSVSQP